VVATSMDTKADLGIELGRACKKTVQKCRPFSMRMVTQCVVPGPYQPRNQIPVIGNRGDQESDHAVDSEGRIAGRSRGSV